MPKPMIDHEAQTVRPIIFELPGARFRGRVGGYRSEVFTDEEDAQDWCQEMAEEGLLSEGQDPEDWVILPATVHMGGS